MSERTFKTGHSAGIWLAVLLALVTAANAGSAYLPMTGPTPLRFEVVMVKPALPLPAMALASPEKKADKPAVVEIIPPISTPVPEEITSAVSTTNPPPTAPVEISEPTSYSAHPAADNLLVITPQMMAEYFKPFAGATNAAGGVSVYVPVSFTPPTEKNPASSRATYKVQ